MIDLVDFYDKTTAENVGATIGTGRKIDLVLQINLPVLTLGIVHTLKPCIIVVSWKLREKIHLEKIISLILYQKEEIFGPTISTFATIGHWKTLKKRQPTP